MWVDPNSRWYYARSAPMETFTASRYDRHPTELAMLSKARLVTASETDKGRDWNESRIKELTGGDLVSARYMRQDFFTYRPQFKLLIAGNHLPRLGAVTHAMIRRIVILPFIPNPIDQYPCAHSRRPMDMMRQG